MKLITGMLLGLLLAAVGFVVFVTSGSFPLAASTPPGDAIDRVALEVRLKTVAKKARSVGAIPGQAGPESVRRGMTHYAENCMPCHGAPDGSAAEFSQGLNPMPPALQMDRTQAMSDAEIFWIVKNGLRMTGMPAFGINHKDDEIGDIVRFVRHLPKLTDQEKHALAEAAPAEHHHHHDDEAAEPGGHEGEHAHDHEGGADHEAAGGHEHTH